MPESWNLSVSKSIENYGTRSDTGVVQSKILGEIRKKVCVPMPMKTRTKAEVGPSETRKGRDQKIQNMITQS